ncbi:MerR family transcriptional regulator [Fabibacter sp. E12]|nr:MerR family transcriptional regulator [Roseivirga sp. E12]
MKQLSVLAGVSIRTLHHYDDIGLLKPAARSDKGYRFYRREELFRLQQIMFYKTIGYGLEEIKEILDNENFDLITALRSHKKVLKDRAVHLKKLMTTIDKTINELKDKEGMITDKEMYEGFQPEEVESIKKETIERWPDEAPQVEERIRNMSKQAWKETKQEAEEINLWLANLIHKPVDHIDVQKVIKLHFDHLNKFYEVSEERYRGLAEMYLQDDRFKAHYESVKPGLAAFLNKGIHQFCDNGMEVA